LPVRVVISEGSRPDCKEAVDLIDGIEVACLLGDKAYDTDELIQKALGQGMQIVIPPKKNLKIQRNYDKHLYKLRHLVENAFLHLKRWRGIATR